MLNIQIFSKYSKNIWQIFNKYLTNIQKIFDKYSTNIWQILRQLEVSPCRLVEFDALKESFEVASTKTLDWKNNQSINFKIMIFKDLNYKKLSQTSRTSEILVHGVFLAWWLCLWITCLFVCLFVCVFLAWWLCRWITSMKTVGRSCKGFVKICNRQYEATII